jgi:hypothetical protein
MDNYKNHSESGQSTIEFILTFVFGLSLVLVIFNTSINYATGYLVHYATFMASRVYLTTDNHTGTIGNSSPALVGSVDKATNAFNNYNLSVMKVPNENFKINRVESVTAPNMVMTVGARTTFELAIDVLGKVAGQKKLEMVSESFLGKEPTRAECATRVCAGVTGAENCDETMDVTLFDDGC